MLGSREGGGGGGDDMGAAPAARSAPPARSAPAPAPKPAARPATGFDDMDDDSAPMPVSAVPWQAWQAGTWRAASPCRASACTPAQRGGIGARRRRRGIGQRQRGEVVGDLAAGRHRPVAPAGGSSGRRAAARP